MTDDERAPRKSSRDLRLPGSVAEIMASAPGPKIGAFFDLDGTLVAGFTAVILTQERIRRRDMGVGELISMVTAGLNHQLGRIEFEELISKASGALRGRMLSDLEEIGERLFAQKIESGYTRRCASWSAPTWPAVTPWCSVRRLSPFRSRR